MEVGDMKTFTEIMLTVLTVIHIVFPDHSIGTVRGVAHTYLRGFSFVSGTINKSDNTLTGWFVVRKPHDLKRPNELKQQELKELIEKIREDGKFYDDRDRTRDQFILSLEALTLGIETLVKVRCPENNWPYDAVISLDNLAMIEAYFDRPLRGVTKYKNLFQFGGF